MIFSGGRVLLSRLSCGIVFNIDVLRTCLEERACSTNIELDKAKVNIREAFHGVHVEVLKTNSIVLVQKIGELTGRFKILNSISLGLLKKDMKLVVPLLKMVKTSILLDNIYFKLFDEVFQLLHTVHGLSYYLSSIPAINLHLTNP